MTGVAVVAEEQFDESELEFGDTPDLGDIENAPPGSRPVIEAAKRLGLPFFFQAFDKPTGTAEEAAAACKCSVSMIAKSIVFKGKQTKKPLMFLVSGKNRVNERLLSTIVGENIEKADADYVKRATGHSIGGVTPLALANRIPIMMDEELYNQPRIWIAAGTPNTVMSIPTLMLARTIAARIIRLD
jgi:prolyl-tRNA editing enzyme YbaK/EbsC (Cys-tRNA(Pro) deacylase)